MLLVFLMPTPSVPHIANQFFEHLGGDTGWDGSGMSCARLAILRTGRTVNKNYPPSNS
jgi:hypothetical protein